MTLRLMATTPKGFVSENDPTGEGADLPTDRPGKGSNGRVHVHARGLQVIDEGDLETGSLARVRLRGKEFQALRERGVSGASTGKRVQ